MFIDHELQSTSNSVSYYQLYILCKKEEVLLIVSLESKQLILASS